MAKPVSHPRALAIAALLVASCAAAPAPPVPGLSVAGPPAALSPPIAVGSDAAALRRAWGNPSSVQRIPSPAAPGLVYERWTWGAPGEGREAVLVDGRVVDLLGPPPAGATPPRATGGADGG